MRKYLLAATAALTLTASIAQAGGVVEPVMTPDVVAAKTTSSSNGGLIVPLLLLLVIAVAVANANPGGAVPAVVPN